MSETLHKGSGMKGIAAFVFVVAAFAAFLSVLGSSAPPAGEAQAAAPPVQPLRTEPGDVRQPAPGKLKGIYTVGWPIGAPTATPWTKWNFDNIRGHYTAQMSGQVVRNSAPPKREWAFLSGAAWGYAEVDAAGNFTITAQITNPGGQVRINQEWDTYLTGTPDPLTGERYDYWFTAVGPERPFGIAP